MPQPISPSAKSPATAAAAGDRKPIEVAIAVVFSADLAQLLICKRKPEAVLAGYWEFPGGKCHPGEAPETCVCREVAEETGITVRPIRTLPVIEHEYPHARVRLHPFLCRHEAGDVKLLAVAEAKWILPAQITQYRFPDANHALVTAASRGYAALAAPA